MHLPIGTNFQTADSKPGCWDMLIVSRSGEITLEGWKVSNDEIEPPQVLMQNEELPEVTAYQISRKDVATHFPDASAHCGMHIVYRMLPVQDENVDIQVRWKGEVIAEFKIDTRLVSSAKWSWITDSDRIYHRDDIYQEGPPSQTVTPDILDLFYGVKESALDFGCGIGLYVRELRNRGIDCKGIELDREGIRKDLIPEVADHIKLYDGRMPLPYEDSAFDSCICSEVLEHIEDYETTISELARITKRQLVLTVPDFASVAVCAAWHVIPFHMLESTHVNFFNEHSLLKLVRKHFKGDIKLHKICPVVTNDVKWFTSLAIIAQH